MTVVARRTLTEQRLVSLRLANDVRIGRSRLKRAIAAGGIDLCSTIEQPPDFAHGMKLTHLLASLPMLGPVKVRQVLRLANVADHKTVGGLSERQRGEIVRILKERAWRG